MKKSIKILSLVICVVMFASLLVGCGAQKADYVIYSDNSFAPFEFAGKDADGKDAFIGVDMDLFAAIAEDQGFTYEMKNEGFDAAMGAVQSGQADGMIAGMSINDDRRKTYDFSEGYFTDGQILVVKNDSTIASLEDLKGKKIAAKTSTMGAKFAQENAEKYGFEVTYYEDSPSMYTAVENGNNEACFEDRSVVLYAIQQKNLKLKVIGDVISPGSYGFAVQKGKNAELLKKFNAGLANIKANGKYEEILRKYNVQ